MMDCHVFNNRSVSLDKGHISQYQLECITADACTPHENRIMYYTRRVYRIKLNGECLSSRSTCFFTHNPLRPKLFYGGAG
jgi:hypothetical protein